MLGSVVLFGALALPFAGLTSRTYPDLVVVSVLWTAMTTIQGVYGTMESSYIPQFKRAAGMKVDRPAEGVSETEETTRAVYNKGSRVSVYGLVAGNLGSITALLIGVVISYTRGHGLVDGYHNFLLAITITGCLTVVLGAISSFLVPSIRGKPKPPGNLILLALYRSIKLLRSITRYPEAFKLCVSWILWNTAYSNFTTLITLVFRELLASAHPTHSTLSTPAQPSSSLPSALYPGASLSLTHAST